MITRCALFSLLLIGCDKDVSPPLCTVPPTVFPCDKGCSDGQKDGYDTDVDCGGTNPLDGTSWCKPCADNKTCISANDCESLACVNQICRPPSCSDKIKNGAESDTDCGGGDSPRACSPCGTDKRCVEALDCASQICTNGACSPSLCQDGEKNASETDVDCGGPVCTACGSGRRCIKEMDCVSRTCFNNTCS